MDGAEQKAEAFWKSRLSFQWGSKCLEEGVGSRIKSTTAEQHFFNAEHPTCGGNGGGQILGLHKSAFALRVDGFMTKTSQPL